MITVSATVIALFPLAAHGGPLWQPLCTHRSAVDDRHFHYARASSRLYFLSCWSELVPLEARGEAGSYRFEICGPRCTEPPTYRVISMKNNRLSSTRRSSRC